MCTDTLADNEAGTPLPSAYPLKSFCSRVITRWNAKHAGLPKVAAMTQLFFLNSRVPCG